jgi:excisionase family DNA binding protein
MPPRPKIPKPPPALRAVTVKTWCEMHECSKAHAYELMRRGELPFYYLGHTRRIPLKPRPENVEAPAD